MAKGWSKTAKKNLAKQQERLERIHRAAMFRVAAQTDVRSPVDSGRFISNWIGAYGSINRETFDSTTRDSVGEVNVYLRGTPVKNHNVFYYTNSLPYAQRLAEGWSARASAGWIRVIARQFPRYVRDAIKQEKLK